MIDRAVVAVAWAVALAIVWIPDVPAGRDIPAHAVAAAVWANPSAFAEWLTPNVPLSGNVFAIIAGLSAKTVELFVALKVGLTLSLVACGVGLGRLARVCGGDAGLGSVVGLLIATGWLFGMGFASFVIGTGVALLAASFAFEERSRPALTAGVFLFAVWCHMMASGIVFAGALAARVVHKRSESLIRWVAPWIPGLLFALGIGVSGIVGQSGAGVSTASEWGDMSTWFRDLVLTSLTSFDRGFGTIAGLVAAVGSFALTVAAWRRPIERPADAFLRSTVVWWVLLAIVPLTGLGWHFARPRMMPMAILVPLAFVPARRLLPALSIAVVLLSGALPGAIQRGTEVGQIADSLRLEEPAGATFLASYLDLASKSDGPYVQPFVGVAGYALLDGGVARHLFAHNNAAHAMLYRDGWEFPSPGPDFVHMPAACVSDPACSGGPVARADRLSQIGLVWDTISVAGLGDEERRQLVARGYVALAPGVLRADPALIRVWTSVPDDLAPHPVVVRWGHPTTGVVGGVVGRAEDGTVDLLVGPMLAGPTLVEIFFDRDGNGVPSAADAAVFESPRLSLELVAGETTVLGL